MKAKEFDPRDAGQINFYLSAVDDILKHPTDNPTIGLLLCKTKLDPCFISDLIIAFLIGVEVYQFSQIPG